MDEEDEGGEKSGSRTQMNVSLLEFIKLNVRELRSKFF